MQGRPNSPLVRLSDRYLARQIFTGTIMAVALLCVVLIMGSLFQEIREMLVRYQAPPILVGKFMLYTMPYPLMFALPWGFLVTILLTLGRLSKQNELVGFRTSGVSLLRLTMPIFLLGILFSGLCWYLAGVVSPAAKLNSNTIIDTALKQDPVSLLASNSETKLPGFQVFVTSKEGDTLRGFHLYQLSSDERGATPEKYVFAESVDLVVDQQNEQFILSFQNAFIEQLNPDGIEFPSQPIVASTAEPWPVAYPTKKIRNKPSYRSTFVLLNDLRSESEASVRNDILIELQKRQALSLACLSFAFIGIPLGITSQRRETSSGLIASLVVAGVYFALLLLAEDLDDFPVLSSVLMWVPNLLCIALGIFLFRRATKR